MPGRGAAIRAEFVDGLVLVEVGLGGASGWWVLDTGYEYSLVDSAVASAAGVRTDNRETVAQPGGEVSQRWSEAATLALSTSDWRADSLAAIDFSGLASIVGRPVAGLLGHDFFLDHVVTIGYDSRTLTVAAPDAFTAPPDRATSIPLWIEDGETFVPGVLWAAGRSVPAKLKLDTGSWSGLGLNGSFVAQNALVPPDAPRLAVGGVAVGGATRNFVARLDSVSLGGQVIREPIVGWSEDLARIGDAGTLGARLLERFVVTLDYSRRRMLLEPLPGFDAPEVWDATGMFLVQPPGGALTVAQISRGTPADEVGLLPGDLIRDIGAQPTRSLGLGEARRLFRRPGATDTLTVERDRLTRRIVLHQRRLP